jgi:hypothetical protein
MVYPLCTDVKLRRLPFYDIEAVLLKPSSLQPKGSARSAGYLKQIKFKKLSVEKYSM